MKYFYKALSVILWIGVAIQFLGEHGFFARLPDMLNPSVSLVSPSAMELLGEELVTATKCAPAMLSAVLFWHMPSILRRIRGSDSEA